VNILYIIYHYYNIILIYYVPFIINYLIMDIFDSNFQNKRGCNWEQKK